MSSACEPSESTNTQMNTPDEEVLTIAVTTFNRWAQCDRALAAISRQDYRSFEVILVDDASSHPLPESTRHHLELLNGKYIRQTKNLGLASARNRAISAASGRFIAFCDDDDRWPESMAGELTTAMLNAPADVEVGLLLSASSQAACQPQFDAYPRLAHLMMVGLTPPVSANIFSVEALNEVGGYRSHVKSGVDHDIWISLLRRNSRAAIVWGSPPMTGQSAIGRMTTNEPNRRFEIAKSLEIWAPDLASALGDSFPAHFEYSYLLHLDLSFFTKDVRQLSLRSAIRRLLKRPSLVLALFRVRFDKSLHRCRTLFPRFNG